MKRSEARRDYEQKPIVRLRRLTKNFDPECINKRKEYAAREDVKKRRQELNKQRRALSRALINLLKDGVLFLSPAIFGGETPLKLVFNKVVAEKQQMFANSSDKEVTWHKYKDLVSLASCSIETPKKSKDEEFDTLLNGFLNCDPDVMSLLENKAAHKEYRVPNYDNVRTTIKEKMIRYSSIGEDSDSSSNEQ